MTPRSSKTQGAQSAYIQHRDLITKVIFDCGGNIAETCRSLLYDHGPKTTRPSEKNMSNSGDYRQRLGFAGANLHLISCGSRNAL